MDNTDNNVTETITKSLFGPSSDINVSQTLNNENSTYFFDNLSNISITTWIIIILILAILGFNIFIYFAKGTQDIANFIRKILVYFGIITGQVVDVSAEGAKAVVGATKGAVDVTASAIDTGLTKIQKNIPDPRHSRGSLKVSELNEQTYSKQFGQRDDDLNNILSQNKSQLNDFQADEASSSIQGNLPKSGWCYIGSDRNFRSCAYVGIDDKCMSGEIFPSHELCINPSLRA